MSISPKQAVKSAAEFCMFCQQVIKDNEKVARAHHERVFKSDPTERIGIPTIFLGGSYKFADDPEVAAKLDDFTDLDITIHYSLKDYFINELGFEENPFLSYGKDRVLERDLGDGKVVQASIPYGDLSFIAKYFWVKNMSAEHYKWFVWKRSATLMIPKSEIMLMCSSDRNRLEEIYTTPVMENKFYVVPDEKYEVTVPF